MKDVGVMEGNGAVLSECGAFRYRLWRIWNPCGRLMVFVMLNPSTADAQANDPTIRKCIGFAERNGFGGIVVVNLFAFRATDPADLKRAGYQRGADNEAHVEAVVRFAVANGGTVVCAWGVNARKLAAAAEMRELIRRVGAKPHALRLTPDAVPCHPLMLPYASPLIELA